jgi:uncharacterized sulfatase
MTPREPEELYDLQSDPDEVHNLASSPDHQEKLKELRLAVHDQMVRINDLDLLPEAEMNARAAGKAPYDALREKSAYSISEVLQAAEMAAGFSADDINALKAMLNHEDSGVRYWAVLGLQIRGAGAVSQATDKLVALLGDPSLSVRIASAECLGIHGQDEHARQAAGVLLETVEQHVGNIHVILQGLNAMEHVGARMGLVENAKARISSLPDNHKDWEQRAAGKPSLVKQDILSLLGN